MTYHYHGIDAEESILNKSLPNLGTWALPNLFFRCDVLICNIFAGDLTNYSLFKAQGCVLRLHACSL